MNASRLKKMTAALLAIGVSGCAGAFVAETDAGSPLAPRIQQIVDAHRTYPRWTDFPATPQDAPQPMQLAAQVNTLRISGAALDGEAARLEWTLSDPEAFAAGVMGRIDTTPVSPESARTLEEIEAFAERLRQRSTAPPPVPRRE